MNKEAIGYYQSNIKTSRNEDSVYAIKYTSQQILIDKLEQENDQLKEELKQLHNKIDKAIEYIKTEVVMSDGTKLKNTIEGAVLLKILKREKEELRSWLEEQCIQYGKYERWQFEETLDKLNELEEGKNE